MSSTSVMWFRRDLRLADNPALLAACDSGEVVPLFVIDPHLWSRSGDVRRRYLVDSLRSLSESMDGALVVRHGDPRGIVPEVAAEVAASSVHISADYGPYGSHRDEEVAEALADRGVELQPLGSPYAVAPGRVTNGSGNPYQVYSPYQRAWAEHGWRDPVEPPRGSPWARLRSEELPSVELPDGFVPPVAGETAARATWADFRDSRLQDYEVDRNRPAVERSSGMSTHLRWGEIHPRTMLADLAEKRSESAATYRKELAWREFYADVLWRAPESARSDLKPALRAMSYDEPGQLFEAWKAGRTGYPIVDAGMRQLLSSGVMHNRVRMIVASFLTKDLHVWWGHGARHFMQWLADGDLASNQQNWQWVAGTGTDASPYFRVFNPTTQGKKFDPDGTYIRRWVPELAEVPLDQLHQPSGVPGYPEPVVDHAEERLEALARYEAVRS